VLQEGKPLLPKAALVTGGGRGLGESLCALLAEAGANVAVGDLREDLAERTALKAQAAGAQAMPLRLDVADEDQAEQAVRIVATKWGRIDILVNNAAIDVTLPFDQPRQAGGRAAAQSWSTAATRPSGISLSKGPPILSPPISSALRR
jgi:NAD(P)-dependent dehydrogenase (short-subunit alcohol dehydrogenase family)